MKISTMMLVNLFAYIYKVKTTKLLKDTMYKNVKVLF